MKTIHTLDMSTVQMVTWHYVMDIHAPDDYWYSVLGQKML